MADPADSANQLSNWGRWGPEDERGALNLITPGLIRQAAGLVRTGALYSLAMPLEAEGPQWPPRHKTWKTTRYGKLSGKGTADDILTMHSHSGTHIDALCHVWYEDQLYNGFDVNEHITSDGATGNAIENVPAIVGRGVLLDIAGWKGVEHLELGESIPPEDIPFHRVTIRDLGIYLMENLNPEELARDKVHEFLFIVAPLSLTSGLASPVNPLAIA